MDCALIIRRFARCVTAAALSAWLLVAAAAQASVAVIANKTTAPIVATILVEGEAPRKLSLDPEDCRPVFAYAPVRVQLGDNAKAAQALEPDCAYAIQGDATAGLQLAKIPLGEAPGREWPRTKPPLTSSAGRGIDVKILVDDNERRLQSKWEPVLRARIAEASEVLVAHGGVPLNVVAAGEWDSDDELKDFQRTLTEFEKKVQPSPAQLAIGFSSQYEFMQGRIHMGGTRGALHPYILLKERATHILDAERLELLVHELGHVMGATHSDESSSVMRPVVGQGQLRLVGSKIHFDAANTLLVSLLGQEIRERGIRSLADASPEVRRRMAEIYAALKPNLPDDPATGNYLALLNAAAVEPLVKDTQHVLEQIVRVAKIQRDLRESGRKVPAAGGASSGDESAEGATGGAPLAGDKLLEYYVRQAALAAKQVRRENGPRALVLALGAAIDDTGQLREVPLVSAFETHLESEGDRDERLAVLGKPTMRGRDDLPKHFFVSAHLVALVGSDMARNAGVVKELIDSNGGSGFSFRDMTANRAGIAFANAVLTGRLSLDAVAEQFTVESFLPSVADLPEELQSKDFFNEFGGAGDQRFVDEIALIESRIAKLPPYTAATAAPPTK